MTAGGAGGSVGGVGHGSGVSGTGAKVLVLLLAVVDWW